MSPINEVKYWSVEEGLLESPAVTNRNLFAQKYQNNSADEIFKKYAYHDREEMKVFYSEVFGLIGDVHLYGTGVELGAGVCGFTTSACRYYPGIEKIYAVELVPDVVTLLQPITLPSVCGGKSKKIERVVGSFNNLELENGSVDFCIEVEALHHSEQLDKTLAEVHRVLTPGGYLIMLDRAHNNTVSDEQIRFMLDVKYSEEWKSSYGYDLSVLTRRKNGEHEIRLCEWEEAFENAGLNVNKRIELRVVSLMKLLRGTVLAIPFKVRKKLNWLPSRTKLQKGEWLWMLKKIFRIKDENSVFKESIRDYTLFVIRKNVESRGN